MSNLPLTLIKIGLAALVVFLGYRFYADLRGPIVFTAESGKRDEAVVKRLERIKQVQEAYYRVVGRYTDNWDSLLLVCNRDSFNLQREELILKAEYNADLHGPNPLMYADTTKYRIVTNYKVAIRDSLFRRLPFPPEELAIIPFSDNKPFHMAAGTIEAAGGRYKVPTYEVTAPKRHFYTGLDKQYYDPNAGFQLGSLSDANNDIFPAPYVVYPD
jgi:hypothetical protein